jgi:hypothetical protein
MEICFSSAEGRAAVTAVGASADVDVLVEIKRLGFYEEDIFSTEDE